jgi:1-deoxy-D-xylulose-5-phosphate reductoisomerase
MEWGSLRRLEFEKVSRRRFPCLALARQALLEGGTQPCALNAADEVAVAAFLEGRLPFGGIPGVIERVLERMPRNATKSMEDILAADGEARRLAQEEVGAQRERAAAARTV